MGSMAAWDRRTPAKRMATVEKKSQITDVFGHLKIPPQILALGLKKRTCLGEQEDAWPMKSSEHKSNVCTLYTCNIPTLLLLVLLCLLHSLHLVCFLPSFDFGKPPKDNSFCNINGFHKIHNTH